MPFISPMLADTVPGSDSKDPVARWAFPIKPGEWACECKYDGHRIVIEVGIGRMDLLTEHTHSVRAWSRDGITRVLPRHIIDAMENFPIGIFDGELLVPGDRSYGVTKLTESKNLVFAVFDVISLLDEDVTGEITYDDRRAILAKVFETVPPTGPILLATSMNVDDMEMVKTICEDIWKQDGEGVILKRRSGVYRPGKRSKDFLKIKKLRSAVLTVTGFLASQGTKVNRGPYAIVLLQDADGNKTTVKTRNDEECRRLEAAAVQNKPHPYIGRKLRVDYQERTPDGSYRHVRWDRWDNE